MTARRTSLHWRDPVVVATVVLPLVVAVSLLLLRPTEPPPATDPPDTAPLDRLAVACPSPLGTPADDVRLTRASGLGKGRVEVRVDADGGLERRDDRRAGSAVSTIPDSAAATVVTGTRGAAPGLVLGRDERGSLPECEEPWYDEWFLGAGASARQSTVIELVNPDASTAVVDIEVLGPQGPIEDASWRGIAVAGHEVERIELGERPARPLLAARVTVDQGRVRAFARHTLDRLGSGPSSSDYLRSQREPATENLLLGVPTRGSQRTLLLANPGDDQARATVRVVTAESTLRPADTEEISIPPRSQQRVSLDDVVGKVGDDALGIVVESTAPVAASTWALVDGDLTVAGVTRTYDDPLVAVVPTGDKTLVAGGASATSALRVTAWDARGRRIWDGKRIEISPDLALEADLPDRAVRLEVRGRNTSVAAVVRATDGAGSSVVRLRPPPTESLVPAVEPAR